MPTKSAGKPDKTTEVELPLTVNRQELLVNNSDNAFRVMVHDALAFAVRLEAVRDGFAKYIGLTGVQYTILISIAHLDLEQDVGVSDIAKHLSLSGTFVTTEIRKMVASGLIDKEPSTEDRRRVMLKLTNEAKKLLATLGEIQGSVNDVHFGPITGENFESFSKLMKELTKSTDRALVILKHHLQLRHIEE